MNPEISVIIPCYNRAEILKKTLSAYDQQIPIEGGFEIIAIDDGSTDGTFEMLNSWRSERYTLRVLRQANSGPGIARNRGIQIAKGKYILFTGDDIIPSKNFLLAHLDIHKRIDKPNVAVLGNTTWDDEFSISGTMKHITGPGAQQFGYYYMKPDTYVDFRHFYTSNLSIRRDFLKRINFLFDTDFKKAAFEDVELGYRLEKLGMRIYYTDKAMAMHNHFYSVRTFCNRQYNAGLMTKILIRKHPELKKLIWGDFIFYRRLIFLWPFISNNREWFFSNKQGLETFEERIINMAGHYELCDLPYQEGLYISLFSYFFIKGKIDSSLKESDAIYISKCVAMFALFPAVNSFMKSARQRGILPRSPEINYLEINLHKLKPKKIYERALVFGFNLIRHQFNKSRSNHKLNK